ncbi:hypothetical protein [Streptomyces sp. 8N706]|uniref:hypothetical protein n=1 Tax=Streptomyces sp. 8N706 TaxID=3457416 RepID=UPI003FD160EA
MIRPARTVVAAAAFLAAAAALLTGCGSGGEQGAAKDRPSSAAREARTPEKQAPGSRAPGPKSPGPKEDAAKPKAARTSPGPTVPEGELTPVTGSFTGKQKAYLTDRVPQGTDPAAVLQLGQETCDRIARTAKHDRRAAVSALRSGEIANAEAAVTHLCPEQLPLLDASRKGSSG